MNSYYQDESVTIYHADCLEILPNLRDVDLIFTSPPYNLGMHPSGKGSGMHKRSGYNTGGKTWNRVADLAGGYGIHDDAMPQEEYDQWQTQCVHAMWNSLSNKGALFYNHKPRPMLGKIKLPLEYGSDLPLRQIIVWDRGTGMNFSTSHYLPKSEWIILWAKKDWRLASVEDSAIGDVWRVSPENDIRHPAPFPIGLPARAIGPSMAKLVLDPFMGLGTTLDAARKNGRKAIGIEIEERFCEMAAKRFAQGVLT